MVRTGELPENRRYLRDYLTSIRRGLIADLGPEEKDLSAAELVLVDRVIAKLGVLRCIEEHVRETGVLRGEFLAPGLAKYWLPISNSLRQDLLALGVERRDVKDRHNLGQYLEVKAQEKRHRTEEGMKVARECPRLDDLGGREPGGWQGATEQNNGLQDSEGAETASALAPGAPIAGAADDETHREKE
jgi:hypothetical protein